MGQKPRFSLIGEIGNTLQEVWLTVQGCLPVRHEGRVIALDVALPAATSLEERQALAKLAFRELRAHLQECNGRSFNALRILEEAACGLPRGSEQRPSPGAVALGMSALLQTPVSEQDVIRLREHTDSALNASLLAHEPWRPGW